MKTSALAFCVLCLTFGVAWLARRDLVWVHSVQVLVPGLAPLGTHILSGQLNPPGDGFTPGNPWKVSFAQNLVMISQRQ